MELLLSILNQGWYKEKKEKIPYRDENKQILIDNLRNPLLSPQGVHALLELYKTNASTLDPDDLDEERYLVCKSVSEVRAILASSMHRTLILLLASFKTHVFRGEGA
jgi:hypothetical protein